MSDLATTTTTDIDQPGKPFRALQQLPREWREPVGFFYACHSDILKGTLGLVSKIRYWMKEDGLTLDELRGVLRKLMSPEVCAGIQYVGQLHAALAEAVVEKIRERKAAERRAEQVRMRDETRPSLEGIGSLADAYLSRVKASGEGA